jgi:hypothetical protein
MLVRLTERKRQWRSSKGVSVTVEEGISGGSWSLSVNAHGMTKDAAIELGEAMAAAIDGELPESRTSTLRAIGQNL